MQSGKWQKLNHTHSRKRAMVSSHPNPLPGPGPTSDTDSCMRQQTMGLKSSQPRSHTQQKLKNCACWHWAHPWNKRGRNKRTNNKRQARQRVGLHCQKITCSELRKMKVATKTKSMALSLNTSMTAESKWPGLDSTTLNYTMGGEKNNHIKCARKNWTKSA